MFCVRCGKYNPDKEKKCKYCGGDLSKNEKYKAEVPVGSFYGSENKESAGSVLTFLFGVIAFVIGVLLYFEEPEKRNTFIKGSLKGFLAHFIIVLIILVVCVSNLLKMVKGAGV